MRPAGRDLVDLRGDKLDLLFRVLQIEAHRAFQHIERVAHVRMRVPWHGLRRRQRELGDAEAGPLAMPRATLDLVEMGGVFQGGGRGGGGHGKLHYSGAVPFVDCRLAETFRNRSSAASKLSTISAAISSGGGSRFGSSSESSFSQKISR